MGTDSYVVDRGLVDISVHCGLRDPFKLEYDPESRVVSLEGGEETCATDLARLARRMDGVISVFIPGADYARHILLRPGDDPVYVDEPNKHRWNV